MKKLTLIVSLVLLLALFPLTGELQAAELARGGQFSVIEIDFEGPRQTPSDTPSRDIDFWVDFQHESGAPQYRIHGFWDGDGSGGSSGNKFRVRFNPTKVGRWNLITVHSNNAELQGQHQGDHISATPSDLKGFWEIDHKSAGSRWYKRSDGSHPYIYGNTHYSFLSETKENDLPSGSDIATDVRRNANFFKKLRFTTMGGRWPHPTARPFFDDDGELTQNGDYSHRPNPSWWHRRVDRAVHTAYEVDLIADLILNGVDSSLTRRAIRDRSRASHYFKYIVARYGAYPNVWLCIANEWDIKVPNYPASEIRTMGQEIAALLPYSTPLSVHRNAGDWSPTVESTPPWHDHLILQRKLRTLPEAAQMNARNYLLGASNRPVINDELAYQGAGDNFTEQHTIASHLGAFLGGGYASSGYKWASRKGQYFWGNFSESEHTAADNLLWLRQKIEQRITFWNLQPVEPSASIFTGVRTNTHIMAWPEHQYVLGSTDNDRAITAQLPAGTWEIRKINAESKTDTVLEEAISGEFSFRIGSERAVMYLFTKTSQATPPPTAPLQLQVNSD